MGVAAVGRRIMGGTQENSIQKAFGDRMRALRRDKGLSQDRLALVSGLHRAYIGAVERGEVNLSIVNVNRIAEALEVKPGQLME